MATKTTQSRRPKASKSSDETAVSLAEEPESTDGDGKKNQGSAASEDTMLNLAGLKDMSISELTHIAKEMGIEGATGLRK